MPNSALPDHLKGKKHNDYFWPFSYIPRAWTSFKLKQPPVLIFGRKVHDYTSRKYSNSHNISKMGPDPTQKMAWAWALTWPLHFTITFGRTGYYMRIGCRYDTIDEYYTIPAFVIKKVDGKLYEVQENRIAYRGYSKWANT